MPNLAAGVLEARAPDDPPRLVDLRLEVRCADHLGQVGQHLGAVPRRDRVLGWSFL